MVELDADGQVTRWRDYFDLKEIERQADPGGGGATPDGARAG
jgi:hypothetical protein